MKTVGPAKTARLLRVFASAMTPEQRELVTVKAFDLFAAQATVGRAASRFPASPPTRN